MELFSDLLIDDDAVWFDLPNLKTGGVMKNPFNGDAIQWKIKSPDSPEMKAFEAKVSQAFANAMTSGGARRRSDVIDMAEQEQTATKRAILATAEWRNLPDAEGKDIPYSAEASRDILSKPKTRWIRDWVVAMVNDRGNFFGDTAHAGGIPQTRKK